MRKKLLALTLCSIIVLGLGYLAVGQQPSIYPIPPFIETAVFDKELQIKELSAAPSQIANYGKVYVLASNGHLYFKDDAGSATDITAGALGGTTTTIEEGDVAVDGSGIVTLDFLAADFIVGEDPNTEVNIAIDYANGQEATTSQTGFLNDTDWDTFNGKQAGDASLTSIAALTYASDSFIKVTAEDTYAIRTLSETAADLEASIESAIDTLSSLTSIGTIGTGVWQGTAVADAYVAGAAGWDSKQAGDASLTSIAALTYASDSFIKVTAEDTYAIRTLTETAADLEASIESAIDTLGAIGTGTITVADGSSISLQEDVTYTGATGVNLVKFPDNLAEALVLEEAGTSYQTFVSTNGSEEIQLNLDTQFDTVYYNDAETTATPSAGFTVDWNVSNCQRVTITGTPLDITFTNPPGPARLILIVVQGDGDDTIDWTNEADILFPGAVDPTLSTNAGDIDVVAFYFDGTKYLGVFNGNFD